MMARDLLRAGVVDLGAPLEERGIGDEALGEHDVRGLGGTDELAHRLVVPAFLVLEDLGLGLESRHLPEGARVDRLDLHAEVTDGVRIFPGPCGHVPLRLCL